MQVVGSAAPVEPLAQGARSQQSLLVSEDELGQCASHHGPRHSLLLLARGLLQMGRPHMWGFLLAQAEAHQDLPRLAALGDPRSMPLVAIRALQDLFVASRQALLVMPLGLYRRYSVTSRRYGRKVMRHGGGTHRLDPEALQHRAAPLPADCVGGQRLHLQLLVTKRKQAVPVTEVQHGFTIPTVAGRCHSMPAGPLRL